MFTLIRKHMKKILIVTILLIVPPFVIWGVGRGGHDESDKIVGKIFGRSVKLPEYMQSRDACMLNLYLLYGPNFRDILPMIDLNQQTWDRLLLTTKAAKSGIVISDAEVAAQIEKLFRRGDAFDRGRYESFLQQASLPALVFEQRIRDTLAIGRLTRLVTDTALVGNDELEETHLANGEKVKASYVIWTTEAYEPKIAGNEAKEKSFFDTHREDFRVPETVKVRYLLLSPEQFLKDIHVKEGEIREHYDMNERLYTDPKTQKVLPFEQVKDRVRKEVAHQKASDAAFEKATDISMSLFDQPDLEKAANSAGLKIAESESFAADTQNPPLQSQEFVQAAFATEVNKNSPVVKTASGFVILSPAEKVRSHIPEWAQVKDQARARYKKERARAMMLTEAQKMREELEKTSKARHVALKELAGPLGLQVQSTGLFNRDTVLENLPGTDMFKQACFETPVGDLTRVLPGQDTAIVAQVDKREPGSMENFDKQKDVLRAQLLARKKEGLLKGWYSALRKDAKLEDLTRGIAIR